MATKARSRKHSTRSIVPASAFKVVRVVKVGKESKLELRERLNMTRDVFGRLVNVSARAIATAEQDQAEIAKLERPYTEVDRLYRALSEVVEPTAIGPWFLAPNEAFGGLKPIELVEHGEIDRLWDMVYRLRTGMPG